MREPNLSSEQLVEIYKVMNVFRFFLAQATKVIQKIRGGLRIFKRIKGVRTRIRVRFRADFQKKNSKILSNFFKVDQIDFLCSPISLF